MIELKKKVYKFKYDGNEYELKAPTIRQVEKMQREAKGLKEENAIESTLNFLNDLGLPKKIAYDMEAEHLEIIVNEVSGVKN